MKKKLYGWYIVFINALIGCVLSAGFPQSSMTVSYIAKATGLGEVSLLFGDTLRTFGIIIAMLISGFIYKKLGAAKTFVIGMLLVTPTLALTPYAPNIAVFYILKFVQGFGSIVYPLFLVIIMNHISTKNHGLATAVFNGIFYGGVGIGGTFSGYIIAEFGWIWSYHALAIIQCVLSVIWLLTIRDNNQDEKSIPEKASTPIAAISFKDLLKSPLVWLLILSFISTTWSVQAISIDMPLYASFLGYGEIETGKILSAITIGILSSCIISGKASDFFANHCRQRIVGRIMVLGFGAVMVIISVLMLILLDVSSIYIFYAAVLLFSFGASWGLGSFYSILPELYDEVSLPIVTGLVGGFGDIGMVLAPLAVGIIFGAKGYWNTGWGICIVITAISLTACFGILNMLSKKDETVKNGLPE